MAGRSQIPKMNYMGKRFHHKVRRGWHLTQFGCCNSLFGAALTSPPASKGNFFFAELLVEKFDLQDLHWGSFFPSTPLIRFCGGQEPFPLPEFPSGDIWSGMKWVAGTSHSQFSHFSGIKLFQPSFKPRFKVL